MGKSHCYHLCLVWSNVFEKKRKERSGGRQKNVCNPDGMDGTGEVFKRKLLSEEKST